LFGAGTVIAALSPHVTVFILGFSIIKALGAVLVVPTRLELFYNVPYAAGVLVGAFQIIGVAGLLFVIPVYLQSALGYDSFETGVTLLPYTLALLAASLSSSVLIRWIAPKSLIQMALAMMVVGLFALAATVDPGRRARLHRGVAAGGSGVYRGDLGHCGHGGAQARAAGNSRGRPAGVARLCVHVVEN
jgi:hypothetical protein